MKTRGAMNKAYTMISLSQQQKRENSIKAYPDKQKKMNWQNGSNFV